MECTGPQRCLGWQLAWQNGSQPNTLSVIESFDPETMRFQLRDPHPMRGHDLFDVIASSLNWSIHDNTVSGCQQPVMFDSHGSDTSFFRNNVIERGGATEAQQPIVVTGKFQLDGNQVVGLGGKETRGRKSAGNRH